MFAVVEISGQQLKVSPSERVYVHRLSRKIGDVLTLDSVLLLSDEKNVKIGNPFVKGASVQAKVISHVKDDKVVVFKKKRRKGYRVTRGHRQQFTQIEITGIS